MSLPTWRRQRHDPYNPSVVVRDGRQRVEDGIAGIEMFPHLAAELCAALAGAHGDPHVVTHAETMQVIALRASAWMQRAAATLPAPWRQNYLMRAPIPQIMPPLARGLLMRR